MNIKDLETAFRVPYYTKEEVEFAYFYRAMQYRWEHTVDPEIDFLKNFETEEEAMAYIDTLSPIVGFREVVERVEIDPEEFTEDDDLSDIDYKDCGYFEVEEVYSTGVYEGEDITGAVIIEWSWEKYVGYARNLLSIGVAGEWPFENFKSEVDLISGNGDSTFKSNYSLLLTKEEKENAEDLEEAISEELQKGYWKWNSFKNNPSSKIINEKIKELV